MNSIAQSLLKEVTGVIGANFTGAYNIRENSQCAGRNVTDTIDIRPHRDGKSGIEIHVKPGTRHEKVYIPAIVTHGSVHDLTYNDFYIGEDADVEIIAGCGVHNDDASEASHNGIHRFFLARGARVLYVEKHIGVGEGTGKRRIDPVSECFLEEGAEMTMDTVQLSGVNTTDRKTVAHLKDRAKLIVNERLLTDKDETAKTSFDVTLEGRDSAVDLVSRSVARGRSKQSYESRILGKNKCMGHSACDAIIADEAVVLASPSLDATSNEATLIHEAAIGKIAGEQLLKLCTLGLTEQEAERQIVEGFLR